MSVCLEGEIAFRWVERTKEGASFKGRNQCLQRKEHEAWCKETWFLDIALPGIT